jgi:hypothetical protein
MTIWRSLGSILCVLALCVFLVGCGGGSGKITKENCEKIKTDMTEKEVTDLLGSGETKDKKTTWKSGNNTIEVTWKDGKVESKTCTFK